MNFSPTLWTRLEAAWAFLRKLLDWRAMMMAFVPYKDHRYLANYFEAITAIEAGDRVRIYQQRSMQLFAVFYVTVLTIIVSWPNTSEYSMLVYFNFPSMYGFPASVTYQSLSLSVMVVYFIDVLYFHVQRLYAFHIIMDIYVNPINRFLFHTNKPVIVWMVKMLQCYQILVLVLDIFAINSYFLFLIAWWPYHPFGSYRRMLGFLRFHVFFALAMLALAIFTQIALKAATLAFAVILCLFIRMNETYKRYVRPAVDRRTCIRLWLYFRRNVTTMKHLFSSNRIYGPLFLVFLLTNVPLNCSVLSAILLGRFNRMFTILTTGFVIGQMSAIFVFHVLTAHISKQLHSPMNEVIGKYIRMSRGSLRMQLRTALSIEAFKTKKKYGMTYSSFGLISMSAFFKFVFFYSELIMNGFK